MKQPEKKSSAKQIHLKSFEELFQTEAESEATQGEPVLEVPLEKLYPFPNHPFHVCEDEEMEELAESIRIYGVLSPILVRERVEGGYEMIAGHRRRYASKLAGKTTIPAIIRNYSEEEAIILMVDSNLQRENLFPSEKAKAYRMKYEAMKHQGKKQKGRSLYEMGESSGESGKTIQRYIWLSRLSETLLKLVDQKKIGLIQGVDLSFLTEEAQGWAEAILKEQGYHLTTIQSAKLKEYGKNGELTQAMVRLILTEEKPKERKVTIKAEKIRQYFTESYSEEEIEQVIYLLLEEWKKEQEKGGALA